MASPFASLLEGLLQVGDPSLNKPGSSPQPNPIYNFPDEVTSNEDAELAEEMVSWVEERDEHTPSYRDLASRITALPPVAAGLRHYHYQRPAGSRADIEAGKRKKHREWEAERTEQLYWSSRFILLTNEYRPDNPVTFDPADFGQLFKHVNDFLIWAGRLIPILEELWIEEIEGIAQLSDSIHYIQVCPEGFGYWEEEVDELVDGIEPERFFCFFFMATEQDRAAMMNQSADHRTDASEALWENYGFAFPDQLDGFELANYLRKTAGLPAQLAGLPDFIEWVQSDTGNIWLDVTYEQMYSGGYEIPRWSDKENFDNLVAEWEAAQPIIERINAVRDWVRESEENRQELIAFVQRAVDEMIAADLILKPLSPNFRVVSANEWLNGLAAGEDEDGDDEDLEEVAYEAYGED